jgi:dephospho-CoA kinase
MGKYLITGRQGAGKSTVIQALQKLGFTAYNTDDMPEVTRLEDRQTGKPIDWPKGLVDWDRYSWNWQAAALQQLLASDETVFIGAVTGNQREFYHLFDKIFALIVNEQTLRAHLTKHEHEYVSEDIERIIARHAERQPRYVAEGAVAIDNNGPVEQAVQQILGQINDCR